MKNSFASTKTILAAAGLFALMAALLVAPGSAFAHAKLKSSNPADGSTVAPGVTTITLNLTEEASVDQSTAQLMHEDGTAVTGASGGIDRAARDKMVITTAALTEGKYMVKWHAFTEDDNGNVDGTISFTVAAGAAAQSEGMATSPGEEMEMESSLPTAGEGQNALALGALLMGALALTAFGVSLRRRAY